MFWVFSISYLKFILFFSHSMSGNSIFIDELAAREETTASVSSNAWEKRTSKIMSHTKTKDEQPIPVSGSGDACEEEEWE
jgi:hypothetical protein